MAVSGLMPGVGGAAAVPGENGLIFFTSGRGGPTGDDSQAKIYGREILSSTGLGDVIGPFATETGQHKHSSISPDRKTLAYSLGTPGTFLTEDFDIYLKNLDTGVVTPITTPGDGNTADRPAFSPDGKYLSYDNEVGTNDTGGRDIFVRNLQTGITTNLTNTASVTETKSAWTPDSQTLYYNTGDPTGTNTMNIMKRPALGGAETAGIPDSGISEFQPSVSPDGTHICFTLGSGFNSSTSIFSALTSNPASQTLIATGNGGNINCVFSPDGTLIAFTQGVFGSGELVMEPSDGSALVPTPLTDSLTHFDGNADWAVDGQPVCSDATVTTTPGKAVVLPLKCVDIGPEYEKTSVTVSLKSPAPINGKLGTITQGSPATVVYTPNAGFIGNEAINFTGFDAHNFAQGQKTVTVKVAPVTANPPVLTKLKVAKKIKHANKNPKLSTKKKGTTISFTLSKAAAVTFSFTRTGNLSKSAKSGKFTVAAKAGVNRVVFFGKTSKTKTLILGKYKVSVVAKGADGATSPAQTKRFSLK
jgi:hypothetical protein